MVEAYKLEIYWLLGVSPTSQVVGVDSSFTTPSQAYQQTRWRPSYNLVSLPTPFSELSYGKRDNDA